MAKTIFTEGVPGGDPATVVTADWLNAINNANFNGLDEDGSFTLPIAESINDPGDNAVPNAKTVLEAIHNAAGANSIPTYYPGEFKNFFEETPPEGWAVRDGSVLAAADVNFPELWAELQKTENAFKLKSLTDWNALSTTAGGVGGVPYFVLDTDAKTIKLPDTRTDFTRNANGNVGAWQNDAIRNIVAGAPYLAAYSQAANASGAFYWDQTRQIAAQNISAAGRDFLRFDASLSVGTDHVATENRPRNIAMLGCVCIEPAKAQRNEATTTTPGAVYLGSGAGDQRANAVPSVAMAAGLGMPSDRYIDLTLDASGTSYVAPADGYFSISKNSDSDATAEYVQLANSNISTRCIASGGIAYNMSVVLPCSNGDSVVASYLSTGATLFFRFVYAQGAY